MNEWSLALRNLRRNRRRSLSTLIALGLGLMAVLLFSGFKANLIDTGLTTYVRAGGHLQVQHRDYALFGSGNPTAYGIENYERLVRAIRSDPELAPMLAVVTPSLRFGGLAGNFTAGISRAVIGNGYVAPEVQLMRRWNEFGVPIARPDFPLVGTGADAAVLGEALARVLQLCAPLHIADCPRPQVAAPAPAATDQALPDDIAALAAQEQPASSEPAAGGAPRVELLASTSRGTPNVASLVVAAAENQGFRELDEISVVLHLEQAQKLVFGRDAPKVTSIMVLLQRSADRPRAYARLRQLVADDPEGATLAVRDFEELNPFYVQTERMFDVIFGFIFVLISSIVLFTVGNTMSAAVIERTVEVGTIRAIGLRRGGVRRLFVIEGFILGCTGAVVGLAAAVGAGELINMSGLTWLPPGSAEQLPLQLRVLRDVPAVAGSTLGLVLVATASAWWPAWRAARLEIVNALRHV